MPDPDAPKAEWRRWAGALPPVDAQLADRVVAHVQAFLDDRDGPVLTYVALAGEVDVGGLHLVAPVLPRVGDDGTMTLHHDAGRRERHAFGIEQPPAGLAPVDPASLAAVLVPGRVFDRDGFRLGRGGGHYDRLVPLLAPAVPVIGVAVDARIVARLPREPHDRPMSHLATELGVFSP